MFKFFLDKGLDPEKGGAGEGYKHGVMYDENPQLQRDVQSKAVSLSDYIYAYDQVFTNPDGTTKTYPIYAYKTPALALERELEKGRVTSMVNGEYDLVQKWTTTQTEDDLARIAIKACIDKDYAMTSNNCMHAVAAALSAAGKPHASVSTMSWFFSGGGRPPVEFFNANMAYATTLNMYDFRRGLIE